MARTSAELSAPDQAMLNQANVSDHGAETLTASMVDRGEAVALMDIISARSAVLAGPSFATLRDAQYRELLA
jgi:hypothetical protein